MSNNAGFEFLSHVKLDQVKKVWKKALKSNNPPVAASTSSGATAPTKNHTNARHDDPTHDVLVTDENVLRMPKDGILKFYTVGNPSSSSVKSLAEGYTLEAAARVAQEEAVKEQTRREELEKYVHCFLDVPADQSGTKPHQALINFNNNENSSGSCCNKSHQSSRVSGGGGKKKKKKNMVGGGGGACGKSNGVVGMDGNDGGAKDKRDIVKIQVAAPLPGMENVKVPMLLYNKDRSAKTFIHPDDDDNVNESSGGGAVGGYDKIRNLILEQGQQGVLSGGGTKAYFYCRITRIPGEHDIVSIDVTTGLAPVQSW